MSDDDILGHVHSSILELREINRLLLDELRVRNEAPDLRPLTLTAAQPIVYDQQTVDEQTRSIGVLNPNNLTLFWATGGGSPTAAARAISQPANSLLVLPLLVAGLEISCDLAALGASTAVIFILRFASVQPAFLGVA